MKENLITNEHFNYATKIMKIMGFNSISDFDTLIYYDKLKIQEVNICSKISTTMDEFKKLFPLNEFDLRRIKYKFENINQVIGFVKKLSLYLAIPLNTTRTNNSTVMRLIQSKYFLYNNYINSMNMRDTATIETILIKSIDEIKNNDINNKIEIENKETVKSSQVLKFKKANPIEEEFLVGSYFGLSCFRVFKWINWIKIAVYSNGTVNKLKEDSDIILTLGGSNLERYKIDQSVLFEDEYFKIPIDFFNNHFYIHHDLQIMILSGGSTMFKIIINGNDFTKKLPKSYLENKIIIECDHDSKYCINDEDNNDICLFTWKIMHGFAGSTHTKKPSIADLTNWKIIKKKFDEYKENGKVINVENDFVELKSTLFLKKDCDDEIKSGEYYNYLLYNNLLKNYEKFVIHDYINIKYLYIEEETNENSIIYYSIPYSDFDNLHYNNIQICFLSLIRPHDNLCKIEQINNDEKRHSSSFYNNLCKIEQINNNEKRHSNSPFVKATVKTEKINDFLEIKIMVVIYFT